MWEEDRLKQREKGPLRKVPLTIVLFRASFPPLCMGTGVPAPWACGEGPGRRECCQFLVSGGGCGGEAPERPCACTILASVFEPFVFAYDRILEIELQCIFPFSPDRLRKLNWEVVVSLPLRWGSQSLLSQSLTEGRGGQVVPGGIVG